MAVSQTPPPPTHTPTERAYASLNAGLQDRNPDTRKQAVQSLGLIGPREPYITQLEAMLDDKDVEVKLATITSLLDLKNPRTVGALRKAMVSDVPEVSFAAAKALWALKQTDGRDTLLAILAGNMKTSSSFMTKQMRDSLRMLHTPHTLLLFAVKQGAGLAPVPGLGEGSAPCKAFFPTRAYRAAPPPRCSSSPTKTRWCLRLSSMRSQTRTQQCAPPPRTPSRCATIRRWRTSWFLCSTIRNKRSGCAPQRVYCGWNW